LDGTSPRMIRQNKQSAISKSPLAWNYDHPASNTPRNYAMPCRKQ
jgi:hypothetical protein